MAQTSYPASMSSGPNRITFVVSVSQDRYRIGAFTPTMINAAEAELIAQQVVAKYGDGRVVPGDWTLRAWGEPSVMIHGVGVGIEFQDPLSEERVGEAVRIFADALEEAGYATVLLDE